MKPGPDKNFDPADALSAATSVFKARGFSGASLSELTTAMRIGKKSLYDTFGNKRALFYQSIRAYTEANAATMRAASRHSTSHRKNLHALLKKLREMHSQPCSHGCMIGSCLADFDAKDPEAMASLQAALTQLENVFFDAFKKARDEGEISASINPRSAARMLICFTQGAALVGRADVGKDYLSAAYQQLEDLLH